MRVKCNMLHGFVRESCNMLQHPGYCLALLGSIIVTVQQPKWSLTTLIFLNLSRMVPVPALLP